ncbi:MAG: carboxylesterase family protein [Pseudomonadota bacterium]
MMVLTLCACETQAPDQGTASFVEVFAAGEQLRGEALANGVLAFRGIPFAAAPVGALRWQPPQPHVSRSGVQDATRFGSACPQGQGNPRWYRQVAAGFGATDAVIPELTDISEDCLFLNVWTRDPSRQPSRPVMVWIHGGSNVNGFSHEPNYLGHQLANQDIVVVSINYRLGALGFMAHPGLSEEDEGGVSGYYGLADQVAALRWVQQNIAAFGGDPDNVTVFGESAGGGNISALMRMPAAVGLFDRAIIQSGALFPYDAISLEAASAAGEQLTASLDASTVNDMRKLDWQSLVEQSDRMSNDYYFGPIADGRHMLESDRVAAVPLLIGTNADEMLMYLPDDALAAMNEQLSQTANDGRRDIEAHLDRYASTAMKANRLSTAAEFFCPALSLADEVGRADKPTFYYLFTRTRPGGAELKAYHGAEIPYVFDTADDWLPADDGDHLLTNTMQAYWTNFARSGDPNSEALPTWPRFDNNRTILELGDKIGPLGDGSDQLCELLRTATPAAADGQ